MKEQPIQVVRVKGLPTCVVTVDRAARGSMPSIQEQELRYKYWLKLEIDETQVYNPETGKMERNESLR